MASSMTPAIVSQNGRTVLVLGSPGGDTIPGTMAQVMRNLVDYGMTIDQAAARGRIFHPWIPDKVRVEAALAPAKTILDDLARRGHTIELDPMPIGDAKNILIDASGAAFGHADTREGGSAEGIAKRELAAPPAR
jgi:gamma-glutamyltranspeptidase/glutathione hydrolase